MSLHRIQIFAGVAKHLSVTKAAQELHISQPSVSHQLKILQDDYGVALFTRNGQGIALTEQGRLFQEYCKPILFYYERLTKRFTPKLSSKKAQSLAIGGSHAPSFVLLPSVMALFQKSHPLVQLDLRTSNSRDIEKLLLKSEVEIALVANPFPSPSLHIEPYRRDKFLAFVPRNHPLAKKRTLNADDFSRTPFVVRTGRSGRSIVEDLLSRLEGKGFRPKIAIRCESPHAVKTAVQKGAGMGILYEDALQEDLQRADFKVLNFEGIDLSSTSYLLYPKDRDLSPHALEFLALLRQQRNKNRWNRRAIRAARGSLFPTRSAAKLPPH